MAYIEFDNVVKSYGSGDAEVRALPREAVEQVQRYRHQRVDGALFQDGGQHRIVLEFVHIQQECDADGCQNQ